MDEPAITPIRKKRRSSIRLCAELVKEGRAQAMVTAGNTGAAMISAKMVIGTVAGVDRPALAAVLPNSKGRTVLLDVGANVDTKPVHLREFAVMGHFYAQEVIGTPSPRIGLMSIGEEEGKGTDLTREVFKVLKNDRPQLHRQRRGAGRVQRQRGRDRLRRLRGQRDPQERRGAGRDDRQDAARGDRAQRPHQGGLPARQAGVRRASASAPTTASTAPRRSSGSTAAASSATGGRTPRPSRTPSAAPWSSRPRGSTRRSATRSPSCTARRRGCSDEPEETTPDERSRRHENGRIRLSRPGLAEGRHGPRLGRRLPRRRGGPSRRRTTSSASPSPGSAGRGRRRS